MPLVLTIEYTCSTPYCGNTAKVRRKRKGSYGMEPLPLPKEWGRAPPEDGYPRLVYCPHCLSAPGKARSAT